MKRSFFLFVVAGFILGLPGTALSITDISTILKIQKNPESDDALQPDDQMGPHQIEIRTLMAAKGDELSQVIDIVNKIIADRKASNPELRPIEFLVVAPEEEGGEPISLARILISEHQDYLKVTRLTVDPTKEFRKYLKVSDHDSLRQLAENGMYRFLTVMTAVRFVGTASVALAVSIVVGELPMIPSVAGSLVAGGMSAELHRKLHHLNQFIHSNPFWDKNGALGDSGKLRWKAARWGWDTFGRYGTMIAGYITAVHLTMAALGGPASYLENPIEWMAGTWLFGGLSAVSSGAWKRLDAKIYLEKLEENKIKYYADQETGVAKLSSIIRTTHLATLLISLSSVFCESFRLSPDMFWHTATLMTINGTLGWGAYFLKTQTNSFDWVSEKTETAGTRIKNISKKAFSKIADPCKKLFSN